jgi:hypothetical protein
MKARAQNGDYKRNKKKRKRNRLETKKESKEQSAIEETSDRRRKRGEIVE